MAASESSRVPIPKSLQIASDVQIVKKGPPPWVMAEHRVSKPDDVTVYVGTDCGPDSTWEAQGESSMPQDVPEQCHRLDRESA